MRISRETSGNRVTRRARGAALALILTAAGCGSEAGKTLPDGTLSVEGTCLTPRAISQVYPGDDGAPKDHPDQWRAAIVITPELPKKADGVIISYTDPSGNWHESDLEAPSFGQWLMKIGDGSVRFGVEVQSTDLNDCQNAPDVNWKGPERLTNLNPNVFAINEPHFS